MMLAQDQVGTIRASGARIRKIEKIIAEDPAVEGIVELRTMQLGPEQALLTARIKFRCPLNLEQVEAEVERLKKQIREQDSTMREIFIEPTCRAEGASGNQKAA